MKRLFFAIPVPDVHRQALLSPFRQKNDHGIRWVQKENLHITLHFLGAVSDEKQLQISSVVEPLCNQAVAFDLILDDFTVVSKDNKPTMIWAQFADQGSFNNLCKALRKLFPTGETRNPLPHVTLARIRQLRRLPFEIPAAKALSIHVDFIELWESVLHEKGAEYKSLMQWKLNA